MTDAMKAAHVRDAAKALRDDVSAIPVERQAMRELIALEDCSLAILFDAFKKLP